MFSEVIAVFSQFTENILTNLLWSFKLYQGAKMFLILITPHEKYDYLNRNAADFFEQQSICEISIFLGLCY